MQKSNYIKAFYIGNNGVAYVIKVKDKYLAMIYFVNNHSQDNIYDWTIKQGKRVKDKQNAVRYIKRNLN